MSRRRGACSWIAAAMAAAVGVVALSACGGGSSGSEGSGGDSLTDDEVSAALAQIADDTIIPSYVALSAALDDLATQTDALCAEPSAEALGSAQDAWRASIVAWQATRAGAVGPAMEQRLMSEVAFAARPATIDTLLEGDDPVGPDALADEGAPVRGLYAAEHALFGEGSEALATEAGARRCAYASSVASLSAAAADDVEQAWVDGDGRDRFVDGIAGGPRSTLAVLLNEVSRRLNEVDTQGLRDMAEASGPGELDEARSDGAAAYRLADRTAVLAGVSAVIGDGSTGLSSVVAQIDQDLADRLVAARDEADAAMAELPDSVTEAFDDPAAVDAASQAVADLKVLLSTEVASELGVTITFSDADGDS